MIIKKMDSKEEEIREFVVLLRGGLTPQQRFWIEKELRAIRSGVNGEKDSAYYIDFYFANSKNWAVIHDLRLVDKGRVAQIDHLLINRFFDIYVLESKSFSYKVKIGPEEEFQAGYGNDYFGIPSPVEQNKRHVDFLDRFLKDHDILPKRYGIPIRPRMMNFVLISPKSIISRPPEKKFDTSNVIKADTLRTKIDEVVEKWNPLSNLATLSKISSTQILRDTARRLAAFHRPTKVDFRAKFGIQVRSYPTSVNELPLKHSNSKTSFCSKCKKAVSEKQAEFCSQHKPRFGRKIYCFDCQKEIRNPALQKPVVQGLGKIPHPPPDLPLEGGGR